VADLPPGAESGPCYPTERFEIRQGWKLELMPLTFGRARICHTDGVLIDTFW
jgi:hypothetical protein